MTLIIFLKRLNILCSHGHPQISVFMSIKAQPYAHKSREMKNTQKSTRVSQELMVGSIILEVFSNVNDSMIKF